MALPLNRKNEGGIIESETLNLTRITTVLAGGAAAITASGFDWAGFSPNQRLVLVVAAVAAIALISCADIMARAMATGKAANEPIQGPSTPNTAKVRTGIGGLRVK